MSENSTGDLDDLVEVDERLDVDEHHKMDDGNDDDDGATTSGLFAWVGEHGWKMLTAAICGVIALSAIRGVINGYTPAGDNALLELRARDVFTEYHPLLGTGSSASISTGVELNHPGPLLFDIMAMPIKWFGESAGIAFSIGLLNIVAVCLVGVIVASAIGTRAALVVQAVTAGLAWTLGSELLYDLWQPNVLVLTFWLVMCAVWAVSTGAIRWLPVAVGFGSLAMQTHLSYAFLVPILLAFAIGHVAWTNRGSSPWSQLRRPLAFATGLIAVLWSQPLYEQFFGPGAGNMGRIIEAGTGAGDGEKVPSVTTGLSLGVRTVADVMALPPWWGRPGYDDALSETQLIVDSNGEASLAIAGMPSLGASLVGLVVMVALLGTAWWGVRRSPALSAGFQVLCVALVMATLTAIITPIDILGMSPHKLRWMWVVGAFGTALLAMSAIEMANARQRTALGRYFVAAAGAAGLLAAIATVPTYAAESGPMASRITFETVRSIRDQVADYVDANPEQMAKIMMDADGIGFAEPYTSPVIAELAASGVDFVVPEEPFLRQVDEGRRLDNEVRSTVFVRVGGEALFQPGATRIAFVDGERTPWTKDVITDRAVGVFLVDPGVPVPGAGE